MATEEQTKTDLLTLIVNLEQFLITPLIDALTFL